MRKDIATLYGDIVFQNAQVDPLESSDASISRRPIDKKTTLFLLSIPITVSASADMFKCKDAEGKIAYQDASCATTTVAKLKRDTSVGDPAVVAKRQAESAQFSERYVTRLNAEAEASEKRQQIAMESRKAAALEDQAEAMRQQARAIENAGRRRWR